MDNVKSCDRIKFHVSEIDLFANDGRMELAARGDV